MKNLINFFLDICVDLWGRFLFLWPRQWIRAFGSLLGVLWFDVLRFRRRIVMDNLKLAFPDMPEDEKIRIGRASVYQLGSQFTEFMTLPLLNQQWLEKNAKYEGLEFFEKALSKNKGVLLLSMHIGHGDMGASLIAMKKYPVYLITKFFKTEWFNRLWFRIRKAQGVHFIEPHGTQTPFEILKALKSNAAVIFVVDQFMGRPFGIPTTFFGVRTGTAYGLALFYLKTKAPVVPVYTFEGDDGRVHLVFEPELHLDSLVGSDKDKNIAQLTQYFSDQVERLVRKYPSQWMWVHRRWKDIE